MKSSIIALVAAAVLLGAGMAWAQPAPDGETRSAFARDGWRLFEATAYSGFTYVGQTNTGVNYRSGAVPTGTDVTNGGALRADWGRFRNRSSIAISYGASYYGFLRYSEWSSLNHSASLRATKTVGYKWDTELSAVATIRSLNSFLFASPSVSNVVAAPGSFDNLTDAVLAGRYSNQQLSSALTPARESPLATALYSQRSLNVSLLGSVTYRHSPRLSLRVDTNVLRTQGLSEGQPAGASSHALVQRATTGTVRAALSYSSSPRTQVGLEIAESRNISDYVDSYMTKALASLGRKIGGRWFVQSAAGVSAVSSSRQQYQTSSNPQFTAHGSIGYKVAAQSLMATIDRAPSDMYGIGGGYTLSTGGAWQWHRPGSSWQLSADLRQQHFGSSSVQRLDGWMASGAVLRALSRRTGVQIMYSYMNNNTGANTGLQGTQGMKVHSVRVAAVWRNEPLR